MKKILIVAFCIILMCGLFAGCASSSGELKLDDFDIYENGKAVLKSNDFENNFESIEALQMYDFEGRKLETKRGIGLGSSAREVAEAYKGIKSPMLDANLTLEEYLESSNKAENYIAAFDMESGGKRYIINLSISGNVVEGISFMITDK